MRLERARDGVLIMPYDDTSRQTRVDVSLSEAVRFAHRYATSVIELCRQHQSTRVISKSVHSDVLRLSHTS